MRKTEEIDLDLIKKIGESYKAFNMWPDSPEAIPIEIAARAAEMAYRRGVQQGANYMLWHLHGKPKWPRAESDGPGGTFLRKLLNWRSRGDRQKYAKAELPPSWDADRQAPRQGNEQ